MSTETLFVEGIQCTIEDGRPTGKEDWPAPCNRWMIDGVVGSRRFARAGETRELAIANARESIVCLRAEHEAIHQ